MTLHSSTPAGSVVYYHAETGRYRLGVPRDTVLSQNYLLYNPATETEVPVEAFHLDLPAAGQAQAPAAGMGETNPQPPRRPSTQSISQNPHLPQRIAEPRHETNPPQTPWLPSTNAPKPPAVTLIPALPATPYRDELDTHGPPKSDGYLEAQRRFLV